MEAVSTRKGINSRTDFSLSYAWGQTKVCPTVMALCLSLLFLLLTGTRNTFAQVPLKSDQIPPFPLKLLADSENETQQDGVTASFPVGVRLTNFAISLEAISFSGQDKAGLPWTVELDNQHIGLGYKLYSGDLDQNGLVDAVLVTDTGANGPLPASILSILTFDQQGRPLLWQAGLNVRAEKAGIAQLVDLNQDRKAELITEHFDADGAGQADGYFVTDIYQAEAGRWRKSSEFAGVTLPVYAHVSASSEAPWLIRPPEKLPAERPAFAPDLSNVAPVAEGKAGLSGLVKENGDELELVRAADRCTPPDFILVEDSKLRRTISILSGSDEAKLKPLLTQLKVKLYGNCAPGQLSPRLIWITK
jgi:hypothetical protein